MKLSKVASEAIKKACMEAGSAEEIISSVSKHGINISWDEAAAFFADIQKRKKDGKFELTDEELAKVVGGLRAVSS